ncbi:hypothetical protein DFH06DRAFT_1329193 [Mycena polygramma]|nr:hypothetical protein DFH06DRAFT_1329193 [Mycena polygramma]
MSQPQSNDDSIASAVSPAADAVESSATDLSPPTMPVVVYNISDLASDSYSVVDGSAIESSLADYDNHSDHSSDVEEAEENQSVATDAAEAAEAPKALTLAEAFELLSMGAAAVSQASAAAAAAAARQDAADAAAAAAAAAAAPAAGAAAAPFIPPFVQSTGPWVVGSVYNVIPAAHLTGIDEVADKWYAITKGTYVGVTKHNNLSSNATIGVSGSQQNGFPLQSDAITAFNTALDGGMVFECRLSHWVEMPSLEHQLVALSLDDSRSPSPASLSSSSASTEYFSDNEPNTPPPSPPPSPRTPPRPSAAAPSTGALLQSPSPSRLYRFGSPGNQALTQDWSEAAHATIGRRDLTVQRVSASPRKPKKTKAYAVFFGLTPGWYLSWDIAGPLVTGVTGSIYLAYPSEPAARAAFEYAQSKSWTGVCTGRSVPYEAVPHHGLPTPATEPLTPLHCGTWYVVYKGIVPGVYQSFVECGLNTVGIAGATYDCSEDKDTALGNFARATTKGSTGRLYVPHVSRAPL